jgi:DNA-binding SARP family transcriptional activator
MAGIPTDTLSLSGRRLLTYLALRGRARRCELAGTIWPDATEDHAMGSLRTTLWRLRGIDRELVAGTVDDLWLGSHVTVDVHQLLAAIREIYTGMERTAIPDGLLSGDLAPAMHDDWLVMDRERLRQQRLHALESLAEAFADRGRHELALAAGLAAVRAAPLRESAQRAVIAAYLRLGRISDARGQAEQFRIRLCADLGIEPSVRLQSLVG